MAASLCLAQDSGEPPAEAVYVEVEPGDQPAKPAAPPEKAKADEADGDKDELAPIWPGGLGTDDEEESDSADDSDLGKRSLLDDDVTVPLSRPRGYKAPKPKAPLPVDQAMTVNRLCRISRERRTHWVLVTFLPADDKAPEPARWALPNRILAGMETQAARDPMTVFRVTGQNTIYDGRGFILIRNATTEGDEPTFAADPQADAASAESSGADEAAEADDQTPSKEVTSDEILAELFDEKPGAPVIPEARRPYTERKQPSSVSSSGDAKVVHPGRGHMVVDRLVTLMPAGKAKWLEARFETDNTGQEPPLRLLPCSMLARAEGIAKQNRHHTQRFWVSGEITEYRKRRYLLVRKIVVKRDLGEF